MPLGKFAKRSRKVLLRRRPHVNLSVALVHMCEHTRVQLLCELLRLSALRDAVARYREAVSSSARVLNAVADYRDAYVYHRAAEELDLGWLWDFSDIEEQRSMAFHFGQMASRMAQPRSRFSGARLACTSKALAEELEQNRELEQTVRWLRGLPDSVNFFVDLLRDSADILEAAGEVVGSQTRNGICYLEVAKVCADGSVLKDLASSLREFGEALEDSTPPRRPAPMRQAEA